MSKKPRFAPMPTVVTIGTVGYQVVVDPDEWVRVERQAGREAFGYTDNTTAVMYVHPDHDPQVQRLTLWHEVMHALCCTVMGAPDWDGLGETVADREETVVRSWEHPVLAVMRDNPALVAYLTGGDQ